MITTAKFFMMAAMTALLAIASPELAAAPASELANFLDSDAEIFETPVAKLLKTYPKTFQYTDASKTRLLFSISSKNPVEWMGYLLQEITIDCDAKGNIDSMVVSIYNRGDHGKWTMREFDAAVRNLVAKFTERFNGQPATRNSSTLARSLIQQYTWTGRGIMLSMRFSRDRDSPEYITVDIQRPGALPGFKRQLRTDVDVKTLTGNLRTGKNGERFFTLPMVDQGAKGYCAAAVVERVMRYYGSEIDQHMAAQLMDSSATGGTSAKKTKEMLARLGPRLGYRYVSIYDYDGFTGRNGLATLKAYNRLARRAKLPPVKIGKISGFPQFDFELFKKLRERESHDQNRFYEGVKSYIDRGIPVCWGVMIFPGQEKKVKKIEFHLRIINGYNPKDQTLIYTDSWGRGFEARAMPLADAWTGTLSAFVMMPRPTSQL